MNSHAKKEKILTVSKKTIVFHPLSIKIELFLHLAAVELLKPSPRDHNTCIYRFRRYF
jgi:hypothetical protein